jgi:hypothetical protein
VLRDSPASGAQGIFGVFMHEGGHILGLMHPCEPQGVDGAPDCASGNYSEPIMYPLYDSQRTSLSADDEAGVCFLYPGASCEIEGCAPGQECTADGCSDRCAGVLCAVGEFCVSDQCVTSDKVCEAANCGVCESSADCSSDLTCGTEGRCVVGVGANGDPCDSDRDCSSTVCGPEGYCTNSCFDDADCGLGGACEEAACVEALKPLGSECAGSAECIGNECVDPDTGQHAVCTRACGGELAACPSDWTCGDVDQRNVCVPPYTASGCGCSMLGRASGAWPSAIATLVALFLIRRRQARNAGARPVSVSPRLEVP